jgi:hypothetical protein
MDNTFRTYTYPRKYQFVMGEKLEQEGFYKILDYDTSGVAGYISQAAQILFSQFTQTPIKSLKELRSDNNLYTINWIQEKTNAKMSSNQFSYKQFAKDLRETSEINTESYNLPLIYSGWLDRGIEISINWHFTDGSGDSVKMTDGTLQSEYGDKFPIKATLDREGHILTSLHAQLIKRIIAQRNRLVLNSDKSLTIDWIFELRNLINDIISLVDITLNQLYLKAEFNPDSNWNFNLEKLGSRINRRLTDKLKWIKSITGNELNIEKERESLMRIKAIRNHLNHFDPPTLVIPIEEACDWLNDIVVIGQILVKIRLACSTTISIPLAELISQKLVKFVPYVGSELRTKLDSQKNGYLSSTWSMMETAGNSAHQKSQTF